MWSCSDILSSLFVFPSNPLHVEKSIFTQPEDGADGKQLHGVQFCFQEIYSWPEGKKHKNPHHAAEGSRGSL